MPFWVPSNLDMDPKHVPPVQEVNRYLGPEPRPYQRGDAGPGDRTGTAMEDNVRQVSQAAGRLQGAGPASSDPDVSAIVIGKPRPVHPAPQLVQSPAWEADTASATTTAAAPARVTFWGGPAASFSV